LHRSRHTSEEPHLWYAEGSRPAWREADQEDAAALRAGIGETFLWEKLARGSRLLLRAVARFHELVRRREPVCVELVDGGRVDGTIEAVGSDYPEIAEHDPGEARRRRAVKARRFLGLAPIAAVTIPRARR
jgi:hypothetical protein